MMQSVIIRCATTPLKETEKELVFRKELVYPGHFVKKSSKGNVEFELPVDESLMNHWVATFNKMTENGVEVPVPVEHTTDPSQRRGTVVDLKVEPSEEREGDALFAYIKFNDKDAANQYKHTGISLYCPPDFVDGKGRKYVRPITHAALTDYPLIPGLGKFEAIAASLVLSNSEDRNAMLAELAAEMGLDVPEGASDEDIKALILEAWNAGGEEEAPAEDDILEEDPLMEDDMDEEMPMSNEDEVPEEEDPIPEVAASVVKQVLRSRKIELEGLAKDLKITPAARDQYIAKYCTRDKVAFALSHGGSDEYDAVVSALAMNKPFAAGHERSGHQARKTDDGKSCVVAEAEARAKRARGES